MHSFDDRHRPFLPPALPPGASLIRAVAARVIAYQAGPTGPYRNADDVVRQFWGSDRAAVALVEHQRAAVPISSTGTVPSVLSTSVADFIGALPASGAAQLISRGVQLPFNRAHTVVLPGLVTAPVVGFVAEGAPIPVAQAAFDGEVLGPPKKLAVISGLTSELSTVTGSVAETTIRMVLEGAASKTLDTVLFDDQPADAIRPAGLLDGVVPIAGASGGTPAEAIAADLQAALEAIVAAGGGADIVVVVNTAKAGTLPILAPGFAYPIIASPAVPIDTMIVLDAAGFVSGFSPVPDVDVSRDAVLHFDDAPLAISTPGTPATVAAPTRSLWQQDVYALRLILRCAWAMRAPGLVQAVQPVTW